jgi:tryptophanase
MMIHCWAYVAEHIQLDVSAKQRVRSPERLSFAMQGDPREPFQRKCAFDVGELVLPRHHFRVAQMMQEQTGGDVCCIAHFTPRI